MIKPKIIKIRNARMYCRRLLLTATFPSLSSCFSTSLFPYYKQCSHHLKPMLNRRRNLLSIHQLASKQDDHNTMSNKYQVWTIEDDKLLLKNRDKSIPYLASVLNRGLQGVKARLSKLNDVNNPAYIRLFAKQEENNDNESHAKESTSNRLMPVGEVLRRIKWDATFSLSDFSLGYYDRVDDTILENKLDATNDSIKGKERLFMFALPEHRISYVKYRDRTVWDKEQRIDLVFGSSLSSSSDEENIYEIIKCYDQWELQQKEQQILLSEKEKFIKRQLKLLLGEERYMDLKEVAFQLEQKYNQDLLCKSDLEKFLQHTLSMYRDAMKEIRNDEQHRLLEMNPKQSLIIPETDSQFLDLLSELVSFLPSVNLREQILTEIESTIVYLDGSGSTQKNKPALPKLNEDDLTESFVRGSGAGGQKINKTSNKVVLLHKPTNLRVECQDTRSLTQNRKIARKRLQLKVEEYLLGSQSRVKQKAVSKVEKKAKSKARSKARLKKKQELKTVSKQQKQSNNDDFDEYPR